MRRALGAGLALGIASAGLAARGSEPIAIPDVPPAGLWIASGGGDIRVLDKQKAETKLLALRLGQTATYETLAITLVACMVHAPGVPQDAAGFLRVVDTRPDEPGFSGWMLQQEPGLAMLESPVYAVRVAGCDRPSAAAVAAALPPPPPKPEADTKGTDDTAPAPAPDQALSAPPAAPLDAPPAAEPPPSDPDQQ